MTFMFVQPRIHLSIIQLLTSISNRLEHERLRLSFRINTQDIKGDLGCRSIVILSSDISITNDKDQSAFVVVVEGREGIDGSLE